MTSARDWEGRTGESWAAEWRRTDRSWNGLTEELLRHTRDFSFETVLDIGCGAGELSLAIARGRPGATVIGLDISAPLIAAARDRGRNLANVAFETGDASSWTPPANFAPDFDPRTFGFKKLSDLVRSVDAFELKTEEGRLRVRKRPRPARSGKPKV